MIEHYRKEEERHERKIDSGNIIIADEPEKP